MNSVSAVSKTRGVGADIDFQNMQDSYTRTTVTAGLEQEGETIVAAWLQDNPTPSAWPFYVTYSSVTDTGKFVKRVIRFAMSKYYMLLMNSTATSAVNVPVDNTGDWVYSYSDGRAKRPRGWGQGSERPPRMMSKTLLKTFECCRYQQP